MVKIKSSAEIADNYASAIPRVASRYKSGVSKTTNWQEKAASSEAEDLWRAKIEEAAAAKRRQTALSRVSNADWQRRAADVGSARIGKGMSANADKRTKNFEPFRSAIESVTLPAKEADPMANIDNRVKPVVSAMVETKKAQG